MNWINEKLDKIRVDEKGNSSPKTHKFNVRVSVFGTSMLTTVYAENNGRALKIAQKLFGKENIKGRPIKA